MSYSVKINCGGGAVGEWLADTGFAGGSTRSTTNTPSLAGLTNPAPLVVYQSARGDTGVGFSYTFSGLTVGKTYIVRLHFYEFEYANTNFRIGGVTKFSKDFFAGAAIGEFSFTASAASVTIECAIKDYQAWINGIEVFSDPPPSDVTGLTVDANRNLDSNAATDNGLVAGYLTQRRSLKLGENFSDWINLTPSAKAFTDNENLPNAAGNYLLEYRRKAIDNLGNYSENWSNITTTNFNKPFPSVTITAPLQNAILAGTVTISATVANFPNLAGIKFYIDDTQIGAEDTNSPYSATLDTTSLKNGDYTLRAIARDTNGNQISTGITVAVFNLFAITDTFIWDRVKRPEYYFASSPDWEAVTRTRTFEDGSSTFNELNDTAPRTWELRYTGLTPEEDRIFEDHFILKRISRSFNFVAKNGQTFADVFYKESVSSHDANRSWINTRTIILIKYP